MLKKFPSDKINVTNNALSFLSRAPTRHKVHPSKTMCGISHFRFRFVFMQVYIFIQQKTWTL